MTPLKSTDSKTAPRPADLAQTPGRRWMSLAVAIACGLAVAWMPAQSGLSRTAQLVLAITVFSAVSWALQVMSNGITAILMMALLILAGVRPPLALSGFSGGPFWVLLPVLFYGFAMRKTGLAERLSYYILSLFPCTYTGILSAFFAIGFVLALGIPSMTVRTAIMTPIAWALVQSLGLPDLSRSSALIVLTSIEMAVVPGIAFLYGSLSGPIVYASFQAKQLPLTWLAYARVITVPTLLLCALILIGNPILLRPEVPIQGDHGFARNRLRALGSFKLPEWITAAVVVVSIVFWATDQYHHLPSFLIGMLGVAIFALSGILKEEDIATAVSWPLLLFLGGVFGLANVIQEYKVTDWFAGYFVPLAQGIGSNVVVLVIAMAVIMFVLRFLDPSSFIAISVQFLSIVDVTRAARLPPLVLMAPIIIACVPFWMTYQNFWIAMGEGLTSNQAFTPRHRVRLANGYALCVLIALTVAVGYWKLIGVLM